MAITFVGANYRNGVDVTIPTHQAGDYLILCAVNNDDEQLPNLPSGWTSLITQSEHGLMGGRVAYRKATAAGTESGSWGRADRMIVLVYRGLDPADGFGVMDSRDNNFDDDDIDYGALSLENTSGSSWVVGFGTTWGPNLPATIPTGFVSMRSDGSTRLRAFDTNAGVASWSATSVEMNDVELGMTFTIELLSGVDPVVHTPLLGGGGIVLNGAQTPRVTKAIQGQGGLVLGGSAPMVYIPADTVEFTGVGLVLGGSVTPVFYYLPQGVDRLYVKRTGSGTLRVIRQVY